MNRPQTLRRAWTLRAKLLLSFTVIVVIFVGVASFNYIQIGQIKRHIDDQNDKGAMQLTALELKVVLQDLKDISSGLMISRDLQYKDKFESKKPQFGDLLAKLSDSAATDEQFKWRSQLLMARTEFLDSFDRAVSLIQNKSLTELDIQKNTESLYRESQSQRDAIFALVDNFYRDYTSASGSAVTASYDAMDQTASTMIVVAAAVLLLTLLISFVLIRSFTRPVRRLQQAVEVIAGGDLRHAINASSTSELGRLSDGFDRMVDQVRHMLSSSRAIAASLSQHADSFQRFSAVTAAANGDIMKAIEEIAAGADQQAGQTEQSAGAIAVLEQQFVELSDDAGLMKQSSGTAEDATKQGAAAVQQLSEAAAITERMIGQSMRMMESLSAKSAQIGKIVQTITDISSQTNILSLNAAIEASRAGAHGRGFSVIAEEVRVLSQETNASSKTIARIIDELQSQVRELEGCMLEAQTGLLAQNGKVEATLRAFGGIGGAMDTIAVQIDHIHDKIAQAKAQNGVLVQSVQIVASVAEETAAGVQEVNGTSQQQDESIRRIAVQADEIRHLSQRLFAEIDRFQLEAEDAAADGADAEPTAAAGVDAGAKAHVPEAATSGANAEAEAGQRKQAAGEAGAEGAAAGREAETAAKRRQAKAAAGHRAPDEKGADARGSAGANGAGPETGAAVAEASESDAPPGDDARDTPAGRDNAAEEAKKELLKV